MTGPLGSSTTRGMTMAMVPRSRRESRVRCEKRVTDNLDDLMEATRVKKKYLEKGEERV